MTADHGRSAGLLALTLGTLVVVAGLLVMFLAAVAVDGPALGAVLVLVAIVPLAVVVRRARAALVADQSGLQTLVEDAPTLPGVRQTANISVSKSTLSAATMAKLSALARGRSYTLIVDGKRVHVRSGERLEIGQGRDILIDLIELDTGHSESPIKRARRPHPKPPATPSATVAGQRRSRA